MKFGAHLPLMDFGGHPFALDHLLGYARTAERLGRMTLATTVALVAVREPVPVAKSLAAVDRLSGGRVVVAAGAG
jgi:alkanesulfonate monooxygenase SsuD/methylene tetrahydromethanopterin reductase-like flavin-dependent oxidoreductase (luciferase family)